MKKLIIALLIIGTIFILAGKVVENRLESTGLENKITTRNAKVAEVFDHLK